MTHKTSNVGDTLRSDALELVNARNAVRAHLTLRTFSGAGTCKYMSVCLPENVSRGSTRSLRDITLTRSSLRKSPLSMRSASYSSTS